MGKLSTRWRPVVAWLVAEAPFIALVALAWSSLAAVRFGAVATPLLVFGAASWVLHGVYLRWLGRPLDDWRRSDEAVHAADAALAGLPTRAALFVSLTWCAAYVLATAWIWTTGLDAAPIGQADLVPVLLFIVTSTLASGPFCFSLLNIVLRSERAAVSTELATRGLTSATARVSLGRRLAVLILSLPLAMITLFSAAGQTTALALERHAEASRVNHELDLDLARVAMKLPPEHASIVSAQTLPPLTETAAIDSLPETTHRLVLDRRRARVSVAAPLTEGRWLAIEREVSSTDNSYTLRFLVLFILAGLSCIALAVLIPRSLIGPLRDLDERMRRMVRVGDLHELGHTPVQQPDELGAVTASFNELVANLRELADAAHAVGERDLTVSIDHPGDLHQAFAAMLVQLREMVERMRETATDVATAATEIHAATQNQEHAALTHSTSVAEVSARSRSLSDAANTISDQALAVLDNAEQSATTAEHTVARIEELSERASNVTEVLELIREVAARSDLLALNGSLEATRAGEAGRGFALVASEMRRLAERVTAAVDMVRERILDIEASGVSTVDATARSRGLAESTAEAARQIASQTQVQSDQTRHLSSEVEVMAAYLSEATASMTQTRAAAQGLREQVEVLDRLTRQFELPDDA